MEVAHCWLIQGGFIFAGGIYQAAIFIAVAPNFPGGYFLVLLSLVAVSGVGGVGAWWLVGGVGGGQWLLGSIVLWSVQIS